MIRTERRYRDSAPMCFIEYIDREGELRKPTPCDEGYFAKWKADMQHYHDNVQYKFPRNGPWYPGYEPRVPGSKVE